MDREQHLNDQIEAFARSVIVLAQSAGIPLWEARERLIQAFDREAESRGGE